MKSRLLPAVSTFVDRLAELVVVGFFLYVIGSGLWSMVSFLREGP